MIDTSSIEAAAKHLGNPARCIPQIISSKERVAQQIQAGKLLTKLKHRATPAADTILQDMLRQAKPSDAIIDTTMGGNGKLPFERIFYRADDATKPACGPYGDMVVPKRVEPECWKSLGARLQHGSSIRDDDSSVANDDECVAATKIQKVWRSASGGLTQRDTAPANDNVEAAIEAEALEAGTQPESSVMEQDAGVKMDLEIDDATSEPEPDTSIEDEAT